MPHTTNCNNNPCTAGFTCSNVAGLSGSVGYQCDCTTPATCAQPPKSSNDQPCAAGYVCTNLTSVNGGFVCSVCPTGSQLANIAHREDIDSCTPNPCYAGVICTDLKSPLDGFTCGSCPSGMEVDGIQCRDNRTCDDSPCFPGVQCFNLTASPVPWSPKFACGQCPTGFIGDGVNCTNTNNSCISTCRSGMWPVPPLALASCVCHAQQAHSAPSLTPLNALDATPVHTRL